MSMPLDFGAVRQLVVGLGYRHHSLRRFAEVLRHGLVADIARLGLQHADNQRKAVLDPMVHLLDEKLLTLERRLQIPLVPLALDRHPKDIGRALEERKVMLDELIL